MKKKKFTWTNLILAILSPLLIFSADVIYKHFKVGEEISVDNYLPHFLSFFEVLKTFKEYIFPFVFCLVISLIYLTLCIVLKKEKTFFGWMLIFIFSLYITLTGSRILFLAINGYKENIINFIHGNINIYTVSFALMLDFIIMWIMDIFKSYN